jgi:hypothetical protein
VARQHATHFDFCLVRHQHAFLHIHVSDSAADSLDIGRRQLSSILVDGGATCSHLTVKREISSSATFSLFVPPQTVCRPMSAAVRHGRPYEPPKTPQLVPNWNPSH